MFKYQVSTLIYFWKVFFIISFYFFLMKLYFSTLEMFTLCPCRNFKKCIISFHKHFVFALLHYFYVFVHLYYRLYKRSVYLTYTRKWNTGTCTVKCTPVNWHFLYCIIFWWILVVFILDKYNFVEVYRETMIGAETHKLLVLLFIKIYVD